MAQIDDFIPGEATDYWKDRRPPAERLPDCERLLEAAQVEIERLGRSIERHERSIRSAAESTYSFMRMNKQLIAERNALLNEADENYRGLALIVEQRDRARADAAWLKAERDRVRNERDEAIEMLKEILRGTYILPSCRKAAYDFVVRLGGYQGNTEGQDDER